MVLQDLLISNFGWNGAYFSPDGRYCRVDFYKGQSSFVPFRFLHRQLFRNRSIQINDVFKVGTKVRFSRELAKDDVFPGCVYEPPLFKSPPYNIYDFPYDKDVVVGKVDPMNMIVANEDERLSWQVSHIALTSPALIEVVQVSGSRM